MAKNTVLGLEFLGAGLAYLDAIAKRQGKGEQFITDEMQAAKDDYTAGLLGVADDVARSVLGFVLEKSGLDRAGLDAGAPIDDAALSAVLSRVLGVPVASVKDKAVLRAAVRAAVAAKLSEATGVQFSNIYDADMLRADTLRAVGASVPLGGLKLRDITDKRATVADVAAFAGEKLSERLGIQFRDVRDKVAVQEDILAWAEPQIREKYGDESVKGLKNTARAIQLREAQRKFRARHRGCWVYVPISEG